MKNSSLAYLAFRKVTYKWILIKMSRYHAFRRFSSASRACVSRPWNAHAEFKTIRRGWVSVSRSSTMSPQAVYALCRAVAVVPSCESLLLRSLDFSQADSVAVASSAPGSSVSCFRARAWEAASAEQDWRCGWINKTLTMRACTFACY